MLLNVIGKHGSALQAKINPFSLISKLYIYLAVFEANQEKRIGALAVIFG
jgi:hypothetical protein